MFSIVLLFKDVIVNCFILNMSSLYREGDLNARLNGHFIVLMVNGILVLVYNAKEIDKYLVI